MRFNIHRNRRATIQISLHLFEKSPKLVLIEALPLDQGVEWKDIQAAFPLEVRVWTLCQALRGARGKSSGRTLCQRAQPPPPRGRPLGRIRGSWAARRELSSCLGQGASTGKMLRVGGADCALEVGLREVGPSHREVRLTRPGGAGPGDWDRVRARRRAPRATSRIGASGSSGDDSRRSGPDHDPRPDWSARDPKERRGVRSRAS